MTNSRMTAQIEKIYKNANGSQMREGIEWYPVMQSVAKDASKNNLVQGAGVMAAISPLKRRKHIISATKVVFTNSSAEKTGLGADKANRILKGEHPTRVLGGRLVNKYFDSIMYPLGDINPRIDQYSYELAVNKLGTRSDFAKATAKDATYNEIASAYRQAAQNLSISTPQLQAITWCVWRDTMYPSKDTKKD